MTPTIGSDAREKDRTGIAPQGVGFRAHRGSNVTFTLNTDFAIVHDVEEYDPLGWYDATTGRFTPKVPGYYRISAKVIVANGTATVYGAIRKNGAILGRYMQMNPSGSQWSGSGTETVYLNGTTDYVDSVVFSNGGASSIISGDPSIAYTSFEGWLEGVTVGVVPEPWTPLPFNSNWQNYGGSGNENCYYMKDPHGFVHLKGLAKTIAGLTFGAASAQVATLPVGYRPGTYQRNLLGPGSDGGAGACIYRIIVDPNGVISITNSGAPSSGYSGAPGTNYVWLDGVHFRAEQ